MDRIFQQTWFVPGALAANHVIDFELPCDAQLIHVSASNASANAGTLKIGDADDDDGYLAAENFGVSNDPVIVNTPAGFDGAIANGQFPHIAKATIVKLTITDHASHMTGAAVVLTFTEG